MSIPVHGTSGPPVKLSMLSKRAPPPGAPLSNRAVLQRRLHGLLVEAAIEARRAQFAEEGGGE